MTTKTKGKALAGASTNPKQQPKNTKKKTQKQIVLAELQRCTKKGVTSWDFITKHHITRAAAYVCELRKEGYQIASKDEGEGSIRWSRYFYQGGPEDVSSV